MDNRLADASHPAEEIKHPLIRYAQPSVEWNSQRMSKRMDNGLADTGFLKSSIR
jgi:hypothetical protein